MKKFLILLAVAMMAFVVSCEKDRSFVSPSESTVFTIDVSAFPTAADLTVYLVPSENTDKPIYVDACIGENTLTLTADEKSSLKADAYFSVILFDQNGQYLTQNFFPADSKELKLKSE
jgi:hypothetical protein